MPKIPAYTLVWLPATQAYELHEKRSREVLNIVPDSPEWFAWLDRVSCFAFSGKSGHYTARKEAKQRGDRLRNRSPSARCCGCCLREPPTGRSLVASS